MIMPEKIIAVSLMLIFYIAYFAKNISLSRQKIKVNLLGKGAKDSPVLRKEKFLKIISVLIIFVQIYSLHYNIKINAYGLPVVGAGILIFIISILQMKKSWRVGISAEKTELINTGIYRLSRNPAFLGFDLMYLGLLLTFPNWLHFCTVIVALIGFHIQILEEEKNLSKIFGEKYTDYKKQVGRYFFKF